MNVPKALSESRQSVTSHMTLCGDGFWDQVAENVVDLARDGFGSVA
jgi:hypothetical protein